MKGEEIETMGLFFNQENSVVRKGHKGAYGRYADPKRRSRRYKRGVPCRCSRCQRRKTLVSLPADYFGRNRARALCCGHLLRVDWARYRGVYSGEACNCGSYIGRDGPHPHRKGSPFCVRGVYGREGWASWQSGSKEFAEWLHEHR